MRKLPVSILMTLLLSGLVVFNNQRIPPKVFISWDIYGYYLYLPQFFIYDDLAIKDYDRTVGLMKKYKSSGTFYQTEKLENGNHLMKYTMGMAVMYYPFFELGHRNALAQGLPADGYSQPYQDAVFWGCIFYSLLGIFMLRALLALYFDEWTIAITMLLVVLGTNYWVHLTTNGQNGMTHSVLFTIYALILYSTAQWHLTQRRSMILLLGFACGMAILIRPTEGICLLIPLLWGMDSLAGAKEKLFLLARKWRQILVFAAVVFGIVFFQLYYWKTMTGQWITDSYGGNPGEGLDFARPHIWEVLFSYRKGWLLYTPVMAMGLFGLLILFKRQREIFTAAIIFIALNIYIISCWTVWWYGPSFSQRPMISSYALMAIGLGAFIEWAWNGTWVRKIATSSLFLACLLLNQIQSFQFVKGIIDPDRMTGAAYWARFLKMEKDPESDHLLLPLRQSFHDNVIRHEKLYQSRLFQIVDATTDKPYADTFAYSKPLSAHITVQNPYSMAVEEPFHKITKKDHAWIRSTAMVFPKDSLAVAGLMMVFEFSHKHRSYAYSARNFDKKSIVPGKWNRVSFNYLTPEIRHDRDVFKTFVWLQTPSEAWVDDFQVEILERK